jgi:hypothetical protein
VYDKIDPFRLASLYVEYQVFKKKNTSICLRRLYLFKENAGDFFNKKKKEKEKNYRVPSLSLIILKVRLETLMTNPKP